MLNKLEKDLQRVAIMLASAYINRIQEIEANGRETIKHCHKDEHENPASHAQNDSK